MFHFSEYPIGPLNAFANAILKSGGQKAGRAGLNMRNPKLMQGQVGRLSKDSLIGVRLGVVAQFQSAEPGAKVGNWLCAGENAPAAPQDIEQALGGNIIGQLVLQANMAPPETSVTLSQFPSAMINRFIPENTSA